MDKRFRGIIPPVVVPLDANRQLDVASLERSINRMIDGGVHALFFLGSSGEACSLEGSSKREGTGQGAG